MTARVPWWLAVFNAALALRLAFVFLVDEPLLYTHSYNDFNGGLKIAEHPDPSTYVRSPLDGPLIVEIRAPTRNLSDEPPEQGIRVDQMTVVPAR